MSDNETAEARGSDDKIAGDNSNGLPIVDVLPNPSSTAFTINIKGNTQMPLQVRVTDIEGRVPEVKQTLPPTYPDVRSKLRAGYLFYRSNARK